MQPANRAQETLESPAQNSYVITPHATNEIGEFIPRSVYVSSGGTIVGQLVGDTEDRTFSNIADGTFLPLSFQYIRTSTTASGLIALY